ncbi:MAG: bifunctional phosphoglucose/phosphomannose isomerase [bacterium]|nr:bifunctional phosphoglucose/phosphomannose isomerase [bacterium]
MVKIIDKSNLRQVILDFPKQFVPGLKAAENIFIKTPIDKIVICGMGGSALAGALLKMILTHHPAQIGAKTPEIVIWRNYGLPANLGPNTLVIAVSYSGNTEETLSSYREALNKGLKTISIASDGKLEEMARKNKTLFVKIPATGIPPRSALGYIFGGLARIFANLKFVSLKTVKDIEEAAEELNPARLENQGKKLAKKIQGKILLIYASEKWDELAHNWKIKFNENSKIPAFFNVFPELHHNEMNMLDPRQNLKNFHAVIIEDENENLRVGEGIKIFITFLKKQKVPASTVNLKGNNIFEKIFSNLLLADWTTYWTGIFRGLDPAPTKIIEEFKKQMAS